MKWLLILLPIIFILLLLFPVEFKIYYAFKNGRSSLKISTSYLFGLIKPELNPFDDKKEKKAKEEKSDEVKRDNESKGFLKLEEYRELIDYIIKRIAIEEIVWETEIGLTEAYYLSLLYGFMWWVKSFIVGYLHLKKEVKNIKINTFPVYSKNTFGSQFNCIIKIKMVYIINIWIRIIKLYKGGGKNDGPSNRRPNENYNE